MLRTMDAALSLDSIPLGQLVAALSGALDLTEGSPIGHSARTCYIAVQIADHLRLPTTQRYDLYYAALLKDAGCSSNAARLASLFGSADQALKKDWRTIDWTSISALLGYLRRGVAPDRSAVGRLSQLASLCRTGFADSRTLQRTRCERGAGIVRKMGFSAAVAEAVYSLDEHWDGNGLVDHQQGATIPLLARILCLAQTAEVFLTAGGPQQMAEMLEARRGRWFDPYLVDTLRHCSRAPRFQEELAQPDILPLVTALEPGLALPLDERRLDTIAEAFAGVVDAKSPFTGRHSSNVAAIARAAARAGGLDSAVQQELYRAGLLHDLGKLGVPNTILDKPGKLTAEEWAVLRRHPAGTAQILAPVAALAGIAAIAVAHHERMDGTGYHRGIPAGTLPFAARLLAAADVYEALSAPRPYRQGLPPAEVEAVLTTMAGPHLDPEAAALVTSVCRSGIPSGAPHAPLVGSAA